MTTADRHTLTIEDGADVVRVNIIDQERKHTGLGVGCADEMEARDGGQRPHAVLQDVLFVNRKCLMPEVIQKVDGRPQSDCTSKVRSPRLEL